MNQSLKNPQLKKTLIRITLWMLLVTVAGCILFVGLSKLQAAQMMRQNIAMAGRMSTEDDAQNIAKLFTDPISEQDYEAGKALLSPYGVNVEMDPSLYQPYQSLLMQQLIGFCFLMLVLWGIVMLCCLRGMHGIFSQIRSLSSRVRQAADGNPKMLPAINEGDMQSLENSMDWGQIQSLKLLPFLANAFISKGKHWGSSARKKSRKICNLCSASSSSPMEDSLLRWVMISVPTRAK